MNNKTIEKIEIFCKYQKVFFPKNTRGQRTFSYIKGYVDAVNDILNLIEYEKKNY